MFPFFQPRKKQDLDRFAKLLKTDKAILAEFEKAYAKRALEREDGGVFQTNSKQAAKQAHQIDINAPKLDFDAAALNDVIDRAVDELLTQTHILEYDGHNMKYGVNTIRALPDSIKPITNDDLKQFPAQVRPQCTGTLMAIDVPAPSYKALLDMYVGMKNAKDPETRKGFYQRFRQGLDILDLDDVLYEMLGMNQNAMSHWLPTLANACMNQDFFKIPKTRIAKVPMPLLQLTRTDYELLTQTSRDIVNKWAMAAFRLKADGDYFIKTGTYSSKFDFRNCRVHDPKEIRELGEYLLYIQYQASMMAGPLAKPCVYGVSTTNEWVVREYITDKENNPCIYKGLPLHTEYRVFVDCDTDEILGLAPYWEPKTMQTRFASGAINENSPHHMHDYMIYKAHYDVLMGRFKANEQTISEKITAILPNLDLKGQWSIDVMQNGEDFWIIDMAIAQESAFYDNYVPFRFQKPHHENWIPAISQPN